MKLYSRSQKRVGHKKNKGNSVRYMADMCTASNKLTNKEKNNVKNTAR